MRIGIFGGCFNPPHNMHKNIALNLINNNYLDKVIYVPTGNRYNKKDLIDVRYRIEMLKLMCEDNTNLEISDFELKTNLIYTYQTLDYFKNLCKDDEIYFICGSDNLKEFNTWMNYEYILNNYKLLVIMRNNDKVRELLINDNIIITDLQAQELSSTILRNNLDQNKLDKKVYQYIKKNNLYSKQA